MEKENKTNDSNNNKTIDVVVPCFNEADNIPEFYRVMSETEAGIERYSFSYIFVDDGSSDDTLKVLKTLADDNKNNPGRIRYISFSRNFGKEAAIYAGLKASSEGLNGETSDYVVLIDADLQHPPEIIKKMIDVIEETGCDCCAARRASRKGEPVVRSAFSSLFYKIMNRLSDIEIVEDAMDFRMMSRAMVDAVVSMPETQRFSKGLFTWVGFDTRWIDVEIKDRFSGTSRWSPHSLINYAIAGYLDFAGVPLKVAGFMGGTITVLSGLYLILELLKTIFVGKDLPGYESIICLLLLFGGSVIALIAFIGEYIGRMYMEAKHRPIFIVKETNTD